MTPRRTKGAGFDLIPLLEMNMQPDLILLSMLLAFPASARVYKWTDMQGCPQRTTNLVGFGDIRHDIEVNQSCLTLFQCC